MWNGASTRSAFAGWREAVREANAARASMKRMVALWDERDGTVHGERPRRA